VNPDGDTIGSALALARAARLLGKEAHVGSHDGVPDIYRFLPDSGLILSRPAGNSYDLVVAVDFDGFDRMGSFSPVAQAVPRFAVVDHHASSPVQGCGQIRVIDTAAAATGEIVFDILRFLRTPLDQDIAVMLMTAILTDTGSFRFSNVRPRSFSIAHDLIKAGAHPEIIFKQVYEQRPFSSVKLLGLVLAKSRQSCNGRVVWATVTRKDLQEAGARDEETEGIVNQLTTVRTAEVAVLLRETQNGDVRVSVRTAGRLDAREIAQRFGGGGHQMASGCTLKGPLEAAEVQLVSYLEELACRLP